MSDTVFTGDIERESCKNALSHGQTEGPAQIREDVSPSIFTRIIKREIPAKIIYEDGNVIVVPDKFPSMEGQTLVVPKQQVAYIFDLDDMTYHALMDAAKRIAQALDTAFGALRTCVVIEGFEVPHVHIRLYPCTTKELRLLPRHEASDAELKIVAEKIRATLN